MIAVNWGPKMQIDSDMHGIVGLAYRIEMGMSQNKNSAVCRTPHWPSAGKHHGDG